MKSKTKSIISMMTLIFIFLFLYKAFLLRSFYQINSIFPPKDLFERLVESPIDVSKLNSTVELNFKHKYPGSHAFYMLIEKPTDIFEVYAADFKAEIKIFDSSDQLVEEFTVGKNHRPTWGKEAYSHGLILHEYFVPENLKRNVPLKAMIQITKSDEYFHRKYGEALIVIEKFSDE